MPKKKESKAAKQARTARVVGQLAVIALAVFTALSLFSDVTGPLGATMGAFLKGCLGFCAYLLPFLMAVSAVCIIAASDIKTVRVRVWLGCVALLSGAAFLHIFSENAFAHVGTPFIELVKTLYATGGQSASGGVLGGLLCTPFLMLADKVGAGIIIGFVLLVCIALTMGSFFIKLKRVLFPFTAKELGETVSEALPVRRERVEAPDAPPLRDRVAARRAQAAERESARAAKAAEANKVTIRDIPIAEPVKKEVDVDRVLDALSGDGVPAVSESQAAPEPVSVSDISEKEITRALEENKAPADEYADYRFPDLSLLSPGKTVAKSNDAELRSTAKKLIETLASFGVAAKVQAISRGPAVTRYELTPGPGVKISRFTGLSEDLALALKAATVRIEAPIPGRGTIGVEVANSQVDTINLRRLLAGSEFSAADSKLCTALGLDISGSPVMCDLAKMPHLLVAGTTGSGKSVCLHSMLVSLLYKARPDEVRMILIDPKFLEFSKYNGIPHLISPVVTDAKKAAGALKWAVGEMETRYKLLNESSCDNIGNYNEKARKNGTPTMSYIVIVIDELSDLLMCAPREVEDAICRIAQKARAAGMHLVVATQRPSADVVTGLIKANIPSRIALAVESNTNSRIILDEGGAEDLLGRGDMLYRPTGKKPVRVQGCWVSNDEIMAVCDFIRKSCESDYDQKVIEAIERNAVEAAPAEGGDGEHDDMLPDAVEVFVEAGTASTSLLQRRLKLGYSRAARIVDEIEQMGLIGPGEGSKPRQVLITRAQWQEMRFNMEK